MHSLIGLDVFTDTETFHAYNHTDSTVFQYFIDERFTDASLSIIETMLKKPYYDSEPLTNLQTTLKKYEIVITAHTEQLHVLQEYFRNSESHRIGISTEVDHNIDIVNDKDKSNLNNYDFVFFKMFFLKLIRCNESEFCLTSNNVYNIGLSPIFTFITPLLYVLIPYTVLRFRLKVNISPLSYINLLYNTFKMFRIQSKIGITVFISYFISFLIYLHTVYTSVFNSKNSYNACTYYVTKVNNFINYLKKSVELLRIFEPSYIPPVKVNEWIQLTYDETNNEYTSNKLKESRFGKKLSMFSGYKSNDFKEFFDFTDIVCSRITIVLLKRKLNMCYSEYIESDTISLNVVGCFHLFINNPVKNSFEIKESNMIVTGPNAAGKSTFIKSIILNVLMSQTLGIACATEFSLTPFYFINSQINIPDSKGVESLFEAEMYRCKYNLDIVKDIPKTRKAIVIMDELFNSTNVVEGVSAGYSILNKLSSYKNVLTILTTHYPYLTKVPNFVKYKIDATIDKENNDSINYNYKLSKGLSKQYLALRILKKNDFDPDLIEFAKQIQKRILV